MRCAILGLVGGAAWLHRQAGLPGGEVLLACVVGALLAMLLQQLLQQLLRKRLEHWPQSLATLLALLRATLAATAGALLGFAWAAYVAQSALSEGLARADEGRDIEIIGTVDSLPGRQEGSTRFNFSVESPAIVPPRIVLSWYTGRGEGMRPPPELLPGERWRLKVRLQRPHGNANPFGFDYELWLLEQGIRATGYVRAEGPNERLEGFVPSAHNMVELARFGIREHIAEALPGRRYAGVIAALAMGDQRGISQQDWQVFSRTGIAHLVSISGLHITMIAGLVAWQASWLWRKSFFVPAWQMPLRLPAPRLAVLAGVLAAWAYVALAGFGVPAQRTLYMLAVVALAMWLDRLSAISHVLALAAGVVVVLDPWAVMWPGFWLSFGAVAVILYATVGRMGHVRPLKGVAQGDGVPATVDEVGADGSDLAASGSTVTREVVALSASGSGAAAGHGGAAREAANGQAGWVARAGRPLARMLAGLAGTAVARMLGRLAGRMMGWLVGWLPAAAWRERQMANLRLAAVTQFAVTAGLVPLTVLLFSQVSIVSPLANAIAIPVISLLVTPLALLGSVLPAFLAEPVLRSAHWMLELLLDLLQWLAAQPLAVFSAPAPEWPTFVFALAGTIWILAPRGWPMRWLGLACWLPLLAARPESPPPGTVRAIAFDVGQGMALLVETATHRLLYDTGPTYTPEANGGNRVILPYLRARGITALDTMVVSHSDSDHSGGALAILRDIRTAKVLSSLPPGHEITAAAPSHEHCVAGQAWNWDGVRFEILHPAPGSYADPTLKPNARGCTLRITAHGRSMLLPADIEAAQEAQLVATVPEKLKAEILLVPHHGSGTSSTPGFLAAVQPQQAIFQLGYRNRYRHPRADVLARYRAMGAATWRTDEAGAVTIELGQDIALGAYRQQHPRYWHGR